jgi:hypothetical protein
MQAEKAIMKAMGRKATTLAVEDILGETPLDNPKLNQIVEQVTQHQGDQIGRIFANCLIVYFGKYF